MDEVDLFVRPNPELERLCRERTVRQVSLGDLEGAGGGCLVGGTYSFSCSVLAPTRPAGCEEAGNRDISVVSKSLG